MDLQNAGNYMYYKCRSLLACDTGGTVYDTSRSRYDNSYYNRNVVCSKERNQTEAGPSENIIYIINASHKCENENKSQVDLTTHLDDDEFNDYEMNSSGNYESQIKSATNKNIEDIHLSKQESNKDIDFCRNFFENHISDNIEEIDQIVKNSILDINQSVETFQFSDLKHVCHITTDNSSICRNTFSNQEEINLQSFSNLPQNKLDQPDTLNLNNDEINEHNNHTKIEAKSCLKDKKKKSAYNKENQKEKLQNKRKNPFANLKMNSILKGNKKRIIKKKKYSKISKNSLNDENFEPNNKFKDEEILVDKRKLQIDYNTFLEPKDDGVHEIGAIIKLNTDLTDADYFEYVQPRERIIESDMDKLLSPTVEAEFSEILKICKTNESVNERQFQIDFNGNEIDFQNNQKISSSRSDLSAAEMAERALFLRSAYAKKLGYENYFNTSNDSVINEILFDQMLTYEKIKLDINIIKNAEKSINKKQFFDNSFKTVSCTLVESLNEFNRFGGFVEDNCEVQKLDNRNKDSDLIVLTEGSTNSFDVDIYQHNDKEYNKIAPHINFNFSNKSHSLDLNFESQQKSPEYLINSDINNKRSSTSLVIKIKRINDENNEYIIDSNGQSMDVDENKILSNCIKNVDKYECDRCLEKFRTKRILQIHVSEYHKGPYDTECEICHTKFRKSSAHKKHQPWCEKNVIHKCNICSKVYCYKRALAKHLITHETY